MSVYVVRLEFETMESAEYVQKRIQQALGLDARIGEEATPFEDRDLMGKNRSNEEIVEKLSSWEN